MLTRSSASATRPAMVAVIERITAMKVVSMHHDISTRTDEEMVLFRLTGIPRFAHAP